MNKPIMLDSGSLGLLSHPRPSPAITSWLHSLLFRNHPVIIPEVSDYEIRRNFLLHRMHKSIAVLDGFKRSLIYQPITTSTMLRAAEMWADSRRKGTPTADPKELDCDVILSAMAIEADAIVATENVGHLSRYVTAKRWNEI